MTIDENMTIDEKVKRWKGLSSQLKRIKKQELAFRNDIAQQLDADLKIGSNDIDELGIKITKKQAIKIIEDGFTEAFNFMTDSEQDCFKLRPTLILSKYKEIDSDAIDGILISTPATPTISILEK